jgi:L-iditol 2-dehydrogenase
MQAVVYRGPGDIRLEERPEPAASTDNLVVRVLGCCICGTDLKLATIGNPRCHPPRVIGHEFVGRIVHAGTQVTGFAVGDRVTMATTVACGHCPYCHRGLGNMCPNAKPVSYDYDGAFADYLAVPAQALSAGNVLRVPDGVADDLGTLSEPLSCAINAQELAGIRPGDAVVILGGGPLGALHAEVAKAAGASDVMVVQRSEPRLSLLRRLKNVYVIDGAHQDVKATVLQRTDGLGADAVIVCAPAREAQEGAPGLARKGGVISLFASLPKGDADITFDSRAIHYGELRIVGASDSRPEHVAKALDLMDRGLIDGPAMITHRLPLAEFQAGLNLMKAKESLKVLLCPTAAQP